MSDIDKRKNAIVDLLNGGIDEAIKQGNTPIVEVYGEIRRLIYDMHCLNIVLLGKAPAEGFMVH